MSCSVEQLEFFEECLLCEKQKQQQIENRIYRLKTYKEFILFVLSDNSSKTIKEIQNKIKQMKIQPGEITTDSIQQNRTLNSECGRMFKRGEL
jgi:hypothetical protein